VRRKKKKRLTVMEATEGNKEVRYEKGSITHNTEITQR